MGLGDLMSDVFGGGNDYQFVLPPNLGAPRQPNESDQDYLNRLYQTYSSENQNYANAIAQAGQQTVPQNVLDFTQANQTAGQQTALAQALQAKMGGNIDFGTGANMAQQQGLIDQILAQGRGEGPNPALDQLRMTTDQNARGAAAMAASQRGVNPALAARMASQGAANANQQAAGQAALQSAQQQLASQQLGGGLLNQAIGQRTQQAGMNAQNQAGYAQLLAQALAQQRGQDVAQSSAQGQAGLNLMTANTNLEGLRRQAQQAYQQQIANIYNNMNATDAGVSSQNASTDFQFGQGAMAGISGAIGGLLGLNKGGVVQNMADGGMADFLNWQQDPMSAMYGQLARSGDAISRAGSKTAAAMGGLSSGLGKKLNDMFSAPTTLRGAASLEGSSPYQIDLGQDDYTSTPYGVSLGSPLLSDGGKVEGRAKVKGDSEKNDTVPAMLSPGEIVIPRTAAQNPQDAHAFLDAVMRDHSGPDYRDIMQAKVHFHNMAHGGDMRACRYCSGGYAMAEGGEVPKDDKKPEEKRPWWERILEPSPERDDTMQNKEIWGHYTQKRAN